MYSFDVINKLLDEHIIEDNFIISSSDKKRMKKIYDLTKN